MLGEILDESGDAVRIDRFEGIQQHHRDFIGNLMDEITSERDDQADDFALAFTQVVDRIFIHGTLRCFANYVQLERPFGPRIGSRFPLDPHPFEILVCEQREDVGYMLVKRFDGRLFEVLDTGSKRRQLLLYVVTLGFYLISFVNKPLNLLDFFQNR
ncbi:hypothetical protein [Natrinema soli]|uniref:Uncharacterized protein n=1 Tax=Natrinema soli TaxID=1930624 RepID=A0ABD5SGN4_9EURY|nr:hypothetical protein [Natrinema soli]